MSTRPQVSIAVVGLGRMVCLKAAFHGFDRLNSKKGKRHVFTLLQRTPDAKVVAVCTTDPTELAWAKSNPEYTSRGIQVFDDYQKMISMPGLQAVWVSTSTDVHASQTIAAVEKDLHVLCEKPLSTDLDEVSCARPIFCSC